MRIKSGSYAAIVIGIFLSSFSRKVESSTPAPKSIDCICTASDGVSYYGSCTESSSGSGKVKYIPTDELEDDLPSGKVSCKPKPEESDPIGGEQ